MPRYSFTWDAILITLLMGLFGMFFTGFMLSRNMDPLLAFSCTFVLCFVLSFPMHWWRYSRLERRRHRDAP